MNKPTNKEAKQLKELFFTQLDQLYAVCESGAKEFNSTHIPLNFLKLCIDKTKDGFNKGFKKQPKDNDRRT